MVDFTFTIEDLEVLLKQPAPTPDEFTDYKGDCAALMWSMELGKYHAMQNMIRQLLDALKRIDAALAVGRINSYGYTDYDSGYDNGYNAALVDVRDTLTANEHPSQA